MKRNVIEISGIKGLLTVLFITACLGAGFVVFPGFVAMHIWNCFAAAYVPQINLCQGILLWAIIFLIYFITCRRRVIICFNAPKELNEEELNSLMERIRFQAQARKINKIVLKNIDELKKDDKIQNSEPSENNTVSK